MARRALEIGSAVAAWQAQGGLVGFVTLTMRHRRGQRLSTLWDALSYAWGRVTAGSSWKRDSAAHGVAGWLRVVEVTHGANGWHVHVHALLFLEAGLVGPDLEGLHRSMFGRWSVALRSRGLAKPLLVGQDARLIDGPADADLARYFTKAVHGGEAIALELTNSQGKRARKVHGTRPVWSLLDSVVQQGDADDLDLWHEWERSSKGRRQITWSEAIRKRLALIGEISDDEIASEEMGTSDDDLVLIDAEGWSRLVSVPVLIPRLLGAAESGGLVGARRFLDAHQISYVQMERIAA